MNRRNFVRSLGAGVAAAMLPFADLLKLQAPKKAKAFQRWEYFPGVRDQLLACDRVTECVPPLNFEEIKDLMFDLKRSRPDSDMITFYLDIDRVKELEGL